MKYTIIIFATIIMGNLAFATPLCPRLNKKQMVAESQYVIEVNVTWSGSDSGFALSDLVFWHYITGRNISIESDVIRVFKGKNKFGKKFNFKVWEDRMTETPYQLFKGDRLILFLREIEGEIILDPKLEQCYSNILEVKDYHYEGTLKLLKEKFKK
ncbi:MAG: hypothetical protein CME70_04450 [Halobacteriovorax sp.]|nr:hypothetical protein [Halobacteriovorax sp.]|tara:strand:+ start:20836 stop:21303 length:468 start_codon:yes stop_codon:yes gene_type:complete